MCIILVYQSTEADCQKRPIKAGHLLQLPVNSSDYSNKAQVLRSYHMWNR